MPAPVRYEALLDAGTEAFHNSDFYFRGESPVERIIAWRIWFAAWRRAASEIPLSEAEALGSYRETLPELTAAEEVQLQRVWPPAWTAAIGWLAEH